jgi:P-type E1-E2 ATPase
MLVIGLRQCDKIVAMIGDGNNDGLALKKAHIGFSLGLSGSQIARYKYFYYLKDNLHQYCLWMITYNL